MLVKCKECGKEYDLGFFDKLDKYQCSECGGELRLPRFDETEEIVKRENKHKSKDKNNISTLLFWGLIVFWTIGSLFMLLVFLPIGILGFIILVGVLFSRFEGKANKKTKNMMDCPDCGEKISMNANACPKCGRPLK
jgi:rRNA maturation endonuclease Nob1